MPGAIEAVKYLNDAGYYVFVVSNQSGVARGYFTEEDVTSLFAHMRAELARPARPSTTIAIAHFIPKELSSAIRKVSDWRKPAPGMILDLMKHWDVDPERSFLLGDKETDLAAAKAAGIAGHLYTGGDLAAIVRKIVETGAVKPHIGRWFRCGDRRRQTG